MTNKVQKVAIFGGSFDPVTTAHSEIIRKLSKRFSRVVVLPCYVSPFKQDGCVASGEERVKMIRKITADLENVKVSKWEIKREKPSYSVDAVKHYKEKYEGAELYFVIGSDCLSGLGEWRDTEYLAENAIFYVIRRPGYPVSKSTVENLRDAGFTIKVAGYKASDCSSALVRAAVAFGKEKLLVPEEVSEYISKHELYTDYEQYVKAFKTFGLKSERIEHTFRAVKAGIWLSKLHGEDVDEVIKALILHDVGKYADSDTLAKNKVTLDVDVGSVPKPTLHAYVSAAIARDCFGLNERIVGAIRKHTTGSADMSALDKIVYLADAVEEGRDYEGVQSLRRVAAKNLDRAMYRSLKDTLNRLRHDGGEIDGETMLACNYFASVCKSAAAAKKAAPVFKDEPSDSESDFAAKTEQSDAELAPDDTKSLAYFIARRLCDKKGRDVTVIDIADKTVIADYFVIAGAASTTAVKAMADYVDEKLSKDYGIEPLRRDVSPKWAVIDYGGVILHVQHEEMREFYRLEKLWDNGDNIVKIK